MKYISVKETSLKLNISERRVRKMCELNLIKKCKKENNTWMIPATVSLPKDRRYKERKLAVIVTSSSESGILICREFKIKGYNAILISNNNCDMSDVEYYKCDINDEEQIKNVLTGIASIDSLVIFPSSYLPKSVDETSSEDIDRYSSLIFKHSYNFIKHSIDKVRKLKGNILFIHSSVALNAEPAAPLYCMLQSSLLMLGKSLALSEGKYKVRVNNILLGPATTDELMKTIYKNQIKKWRDINPLGISFKFEDFLSAISFLAIPNVSSKMITGCALTIDGGESIADAYTITQKEEM